PRAVLRPRPVWRGVVGGALLQPGEDLADAVVRDRDLALVGVLAPLRGEGLGRLVGIVRVVEVHEQEERSVLVRVEPLPGHACGLVALALVDVADLVYFLEAVLVAVEAL